MRPELFLRDTPRFYEILIGLVLAGVSVALLGVAGIMAYRLLTGWEVPRAVLWVGTIFGAVGAFMAPISLRLITGHGPGGRKELFSPNALRVAGAAFAVAPILILITQPLDVWHFLGSFACSAACFLLARRREQYVDTRWRSVEPS